MGGPPKAMKSASLDAVKEKSRQASEDDPDAAKIFWDMVLVVPTKALKANDKSKKKEPELFDATYVAKKLVGAGLEYRAFESIQGDEIYIRVGASMARLREQADVEDFKVKLDPARTRRAAKAGFPEHQIAPIEIPNTTPDGHRISKYEPWEHIYGKYETDPHLVRLYVTDEDGLSFNSMQRLKLLNNAINAEKRFGGASIPTEKRVRQGKLLAALGCHDPVERNALMDGFVRAPILTKPKSMPLHQFKDYFGEKQGLAMVFMAHLTQWYGLLAIVGCAIQLHVWINNNIISPDVAGYAAAAIIWGVLVTENWKRTEKRFAMLWGMVGFESEELERPQFKGIQMKSPITGKEATYFAPKKRQAKVFASTGVTCLCILVDLFFIWGCIKLKQSSNSTTALGGTVLQAVGIPIFSFLYTMVAIKLTNSENWPTNTIYQDQLVSKLTVFNFINSYTALFYAIFIPQDWVLQGTCDKDKKGCFGELRTALVITFIVQVFTNNFMQSIVGWLKYRANYKKESMGASGTGAFSASFSIPELQYLLAEFDETLDNIVAYQAQATQYGYITLFSSAFPAASVLALLNNMLLMRFDVIKFLSFYRRIQPDGAEDIGMYQYIFEGLNVAGAISSSAIIIFETSIIDGSQHRLDVVFIVTVTIFFVVISAFQLFVDDVGHEVEVQIARAAWINEKIIDRVADEDDTLEFKDVSWTFKARVSEKDTLQLYYPTVPEFFEQDDGRPLTDLPDVEDAFGRVGGKKSKLRTS
mmetsp:Transcript_33531/g.101206  ORF Transcript_33531/g.101206 Transcript_33531/m.101206 type:complete len:757 (+) Transcript_33531:487-2757(+)